MNYLLLELSSIHLSLIKSDPAGLSNQALVLILENQTEKSSLILAFAF